MNTWFTCTFYSANCKRVCSITPRSPTVEYLNGRVSLNIAIILKFNIENFLDGDKWYTLYCRETFHLW